MKFRFRLIILVFFLKSLNSFACLSAKQHKLFPIGILEGKIIAIEAHIHRTEDINRNDKNETSRSVSEKWIIKSYVVIYDTSQKLISKTEIDSAEIKGHSYTTLLQSHYIRGLLRIKSLYHNLDYFTSDYISFCDYQKKCKKLELKRDSIAKKDSFKYKNTEYVIKFEENKKDKASALFIDDLSSYYLSSVRIYKAKGVELVIGHLATGHEVSMGWITKNPEEKETKDGYKYKARKEYLPDFKLKELYTAIYQEPLMHHGYGFDFFIVTEK